MNIQELENRVGRWYDQVVKTVSGEPTMDSKFCIWKIKLKEAKIDFKKILDTRMTWIRKRLTTNKEEIGADFTDMVKELSNAVPQEAKESDLSLEQYRYHMQVANDITELKINMKNKIEAFLANSNQEFVDNFKDGLKLLEETIDTEINYHESLRRTYMLMYSMKDEGQQNFLKQTLIELEPIVDKIMYTRMRWDIRYIRQKPGKKNSQISTKKSSASMDGNKSPKLK